MVKGEVYSLGLTDDEIAALYFREAGGLTDDELVQRFGSRPYSWNGEAGHTHRTYRTYDRKKAHRGTGGYLYTVNEMEGKTVMSYLIPKSLTRKAREAGTAAPEHPFSGQVLTYLDGDTEKRIYVEAVYTSRSGAATGTLEFHPLG